MTTHYLPEQPNLDVLWTIEGNGPDPVVVRWNRTVVEVEDRRDQYDCPGRRTVWVRPGTDATGGLSWVELLQRGVVSEAHPDLPGPDRDPLPWRCVFSDEDILTALDADGDYIDLRDPELTGLIVKAVNAYAERFLADRPATARPGVDIDGALIAARALVGLDRGATLRGSGPWRALVACLAGTS